jgi:hypothetical protein
MQIPAGALAALHSDINAILAACKQHDTASSAESGSSNKLATLTQALALLANSSRKPAEPGLLSGIMIEIIASVSSAISQDLEKMIPGRPWRVLLLNHSIVATRCHDTELMEAAFAVLCEKLPEDATRFFSEGMEQMNVLDYPPHVRKVMEKYHREWPVNPSLH